jgi:hypothetical protein
MTRNLAPGRLLLWGLLALALAFAAWLRIADTLSRPLWLDEGYSAYIADHDFAWIWRVVPQFETHPPFYYSLLRVWSLMFGDALAARRALGILAGLATLPVAAIGMREVGRLIGWSRLRTHIAMAVAMLLVALAPLMIEMDRQVRPYAVLILVHAVALTMLLRIGRVAAEERRIPALPFALYLVVLAALLWLHNLAILSGGALGLSSLALLAGRGLSRRDWLWFWAGHALVGLSYAPALLILLDQAAGWTAATWLKFDIGTLGWDLSRLFGTPGRPGLILSLLLALAGIVALLRRQEGWRIVLVLSFTALLPILLSVAISLVSTPVFLPRTLSATTVPATMLIAIGVAGARGLWRWPAGVALVALLALLVRMDLHEYRQRPQQDWYGAAAWLDAHVRPGDQVWAYPNDAALPLHYAAHDRGFMKVMAALRPQPTPVPTLDAGPGAVYPTGNRGVVTLSPERLRGLVEAPAARQARTIWLVRLGRDMFDPADHFPTAFAGWRPVEGCESHRIDIRGYSRAKPAEEPRSPGRCAAEITPAR